MTPMSIPIDSHKSTLSFRGKGRVLLGLVLCLTTACAAASPPEVEGVTPRVVRRGDVGVLKISGEHLHHVDDLLFLREGLRLEGKRALGEETLEVTIAADEDCPLGEHGFWLVGPQGLSDLMTIQVGRFPVVSEEESNDSPDQAQSIELGVVVQGVVDEADSDCFRVKLKKGERLSAEVKAMRLGGAFLDAYLEISDAEGRVIASCDDTALTRQDPVVSIVAENDGDYVVQVREAAFGGDYESAYHLHIGSFCRSLVAYPAGGRPGESLAVSLLGDPRGERKAGIDLPAGSEAMHFHHPDDGEGGPASTPVRIRSADLRNVLESEPNNTFEQANQSGRGPFALNGVLETPGDEDLFQLEAEAGEVFDVAVYGARVGSPIDSVIEILDSGGEPIVQNDDGIVHDSTLRFLVPRTGRYTVRVSDHLGRGGATHVYRVEVTEPKPGLALTIPVLNPLKPQQGQTIAVPRGGRVARLIAARRRGFAGEIAVEAHGLPRGVRLSASPIPAGKHLTLLQFEAADDAPLIARPVDVLGRASAPSGPIEGRLTRRIGLVLGQPRQTVYHEIAVDRTPVVVTERAPFELIVDSPKALLARDGLVELPVKIRRAPGFTSSVTLTTPLLPDWVERSEDRVEIASGSDATLYPLTAGDRASVGEHEVGVIGTALVDGAPISLASEPFRLTLTEPHAKIAIEPAAAEQGEVVALACQIEWLHPPVGEAIARLRGLPKHSSAPEITVTASMKRFEFPVTVGDATPESIHDTLYVELAVPISGKPVRQFLGRHGTLEVVPRGGAARETASRLEVLQRTVRLSPKSGAPTDSTSPIR
ncbi:putative subtilase-type serine protease precursor [Planctomycetes bacterium MalM25]|nr:putative subtilase-type serine protease precursor [Planctomycetes bacterium MalM25]